MPLRASDSARRSGSTVPSLARRDGFAVFAAPARSPRGGPLRARATGLPRAFSSPGWRVAPSIRSLSPAHDIAMTRGRSRGSPRARRPSPPPRRRSPIDRRGFDALSHAFGFVSAILSTVLSFKGPRDIGAAWRAGCRLPRRIHAGLFDVVCARAGRAAVSRANVVVVTSLAGRHRDREGRTGATALEPRASRRSAGQFFHQCYTDPRPLVVRERVFSRGGHARTDEDSSCGIPTPYREPPVRRALPAPAMRRGCALEGEFAHSRLGSVRSFPTCRDRIHRCEAAGIRRRTKARGRWPTPVLRAPSSGANRSARSPLRSAASIREKRAACCTAYQAQFVPVHDREVLARHRPLAKRAPSVRPTSGFRVPNSWLTLLRTWSSSSISARPRRGRAPLRARALLAPCHDSLSRHTRA